MSGQGRGADTCIYHVELELEAEHRLDTRYHRFENIDLVAAQFWILQKHNCTDLDKLNKLNPLNRQYRMKHGDLPGVAS